MLHAEEGRVRLPELLFQLRLLMECDIFADVQSTDSPAVLEIANDTPHDA